MLDACTISEYRDYLINERQASANTVSSYVRDITQFAEYLGKMGVNSFYDVCEDDVRLFLLHLDKKGRSNATMTRCVASLKGFYNHLSCENDMTINPVVGISSVTVEKKLPRLLTGEEIDCLLEQPDISDQKGCRDKAMLETLYATGMRVSELIALDISDISISTMLITCRNDRVRSIPLYVGAVKAISDYMSNVREYMATPDETALFVNTNGRRMSRQGCWKILKSYADKAQIDEDITPRTLRNSFAAHLLENGADIHLLQEILGHADISSTQVYARAVKQQLKDVYNKAHPRA